MTIVNCKIKNSRSAKGFTLMEAMMAVFILAVAAAGISMAFAAAGAVQVEAKRRITASRVAAGLIETITAATYDKIQIKCPAGDYTAAAMGHTGDIYNDMSCSLSYGTSQVAVGGTTVNLIQITVAAKYKSREITRITTVVGSTAGY